MTIGLVINGAVIMGYALATLFFVKFWRRTSDGLFLAFAVAFMLLAAVPVLLIAFEVPREEQSPFFLLRLLAFGVIIVAIVGKSRARGR